MTLRELFDKVAEGVEEYANLIAERIVQLGGKAEGTAHAVAGRSSLDGYLLGSAGGNSHIGALATTLTDFGRHARYTSEQDDRTEGRRYRCHLHRDRRGIDKWLWFVETSQQPGS